MNGTKISPRVLQVMFDRFEDGQGVTNGLIDIEEIVLLAYDPEGEFDNDKYLEMSVVDNRYSDGINYHFRLKRTVNIKPCLTNAVDLVFEVHNTHPGDAGDRPATHIGLRGMTDGPTGGPTPHDEYLWVGRLKTPTGDDAEVQLQVGDRYIVPIGTLLARVG